MSLRNRVDPQQLLAVSFALIMLVSMGGMAFVGGAGAQTGGTYDQVIEASETVNDELNIASEDGDVQLVGPANGGGVDRDDVNTLDNGSIAVNGSSVANGQFAGAALTLDRVATLTGAQNPGDDQADFLDATVDDLAVDDTAGSEAFPAVFIEFAPQSNFSQIDSVAGDHDFIVIGPADELNGQTTTTLTPAAQPEIDNSDDIVAVSASNGFGDDALLSASTDFGTVVSDLVGDTDANLQNENIDQVQIAAGDFGDDNVDSTITGIQLNPSTMETGETVHSEKITLDSDGDSERYFSSIADAEGAAGTGDTIRVADGTFDAGVTLAVDGLTLERDDSGDTPTVPGTVTYAADSVTVDGIDIDIGDVTDGAATLESPTLANSSVVSTAATAVDFSSSNNATVTDNRIVDSGDPDVNNGHTGLNVSNGFETVSGNDIRDFQTQIAATSSEDMDALLDDNEFEDNDESQAAVPVDATGAVQGGAIYGNVDVADANTDTGETVEVYGGTYDHGGSIDIVTEDVSVVGVEDDVTISNVVNIDATGDVSVDELDINANFNVAGGEPTSLTVNDTDVDGNSITVDDVATVSLNDTTATGGYSLGPTDGVGAVTLTDTTGGAYDIDATGTVDLTNADGDSTLAIVTDAEVTVDGSDVATTVTIDAGTGAVTVIDGSSQYYDITADGDVEVDGAEATDPAGNTNDAGIYVSPSAADVTVTDADVTLTADGQVGVDVTASGESGETISISGVSVDDDGTAYDATGISLETINTGNSNTYTINDSTVAGLTGTDGSPAIGVEVTEDGGVVDGSEGTFTFHNNTVTGGTYFIGLSYDLPETSNVEISESRIVGADTTGAEDSVGINFVSVDNFGAGGILDTTSTDGMTFRENVITGHARLIQDQSPDDATVAASDYTAIVNSSNALSNEVGTVVLNAEGDYSATYGSAEVLYDDKGLTYLPGSIGQAVDLVEANSNIDTADLQVYEPTTTTGGNALTLDGVSAPDSYVEEEVDFPDVDQITVSGETEAVTAETSFLIDGGADSSEKNNHNIKSLTIDAGATTAIDVTLDKAQSDFEHLDVTTTGDGLTVAPATTDVNVIEVRNSTFDVGADGISLAGTNDDRDGFVIDNVTIDGAGIGSGDIGLDLRDVEKPGKDGLSVNLTVTESTVNNFTTQVAIDGGSGNLAASNVNATTFVAGTDVAEESVTVEDNTFGQAVLVFDEEDGTLQTADLFGSVDAADADGATEDGDYIDVRNLADGVAIYDHGATVTIGTQDVTVAGPVDEPGSADIREDETVIADSVDVTDSGVTLEGLAVVGDDSLTGVLDDAAYGADAAALGGTDTAVIGANGGALTVRNLSVTSSVDPTADGIMPVGIGTDTGGELTVESTFVGDHAEGTTGSAIVAQDGTLDVDDSTLTDGAHGITDGTPDDTLDSSAYGVIAGSGTSPTITNTTISEFDADGINTEADSLTLEDGSTVANNNVDTAFAAAGTGGIVTNALADSTFTIDASDVTSNNGVGVDVEVGSLDVDNGADVSNNDGDGVVVDSSGTVDVQSSTISENTGTGLDVEDADGEVTVSESDVESNAATITADDQVADVTTSTFSADGTALTIDTENVTVTENTIEDSATGLNLTTDNSDPVVTLNTIQNNTDGFVLNAGAGDAVVTGNAFNNTDTDIDSEVGLDATLNYFGTQLGPNSDAAGGVTDNVVYDPFLTTDQTDSTVSDITATHDFGHDVVIPANSITSVGFPAEPQGTDADLADLERAFNEDMNGTIYAFNETTQSFEAIEGDEFDSTEIEAFDAFVVENNEDESETALVDYKANPDPSEVADNSYEFQSGLNFVAPQQAGTVNDVLFPGGDTDLVAQPFTAGENLYGATSATQVRDSFVTPAGAGFAENFRSGAGDRVVHPHTGYLVIVNEESNNGLEVTERIPTPDGPTAENIENRTDGTGNGDFQINDVNVTNETGSADALVSVELENTGDFDGEQTVTAEFVDGGAEGESVTQTVQIDSGSIDVVELEITGVGSAEAGDTVVVTTDDDTQSAESPDISA